MTKSKYRPDFHFTPQKNWMNDPNGLIWHDGKYHLYFQHNPYGCDWGHMSWGHATSTDLIHWVEHPVAITEDETSGEAIFSGSAVFDRAGDCGVPNALVACYTSHYGEGASARQLQSLAISIDGGYTFRKLGQPVLDRGKRDFRDPKVFRFNEEWRMVVAHPTEHRIEILSSNNLLHWHSESFFCWPDQSDAVWECPDLFPLQLNGQTKWVLIVSVNPGGPNGGSGTKYFIGDFDGQSFAMTQDPLWLDYGRDNYAGVTFNDAPADERILIGWMNSWGKTRHPKLEWTGAMTIPRKLELVSVGGQIRLKQSPIVAPNRTVVLGEPNGFSFALNPEITASYDAQTGILDIAGYQAQLVASTEAVLEILDDNCSVEIFCNDRTVSFTFLTFV